MNTHADKSQIDRRQSVANEVYQKQNGSESRFQFVGNRPEVIAQGKFQEMMHNSPIVKQLRAFQDMANNSPQAKQSAQSQKLADSYSTSKQQPIQKKENKTGLPDNLKAGIENLSGYSMDDVKVHCNSDKPAQLQAHAYAQGTNIDIASGQEKHLPHEAWHVVQQKQGRVKPTTQMKGPVNINDDISLEKEADVFGNMAAQQPLVDISGQLISDSIGGATIQCKSDQPLMKQLASLLGWAMDKIGHTMNYDPHFKPLFKKINDYDRSQDGRPRAQYQAIQAMRHDLDQWLLANVHSFQGNDMGNYSELNRILVTERNVTDEQTRRLEKYSADPSSPYDQMTDEGMLWSQPNFEHNTKAMGKTGKAYFEELSSMNIQSIRKEESSSDLNKKDWFDSFVKAARQALSNAVVNHYTTSMRVRAMLDGGGMKSKIMLEKDLPTFKHNTSIYDDLGLGNSGFLFFFIESPNAPIRGSRFTEGDSNAEPARISIPIEESGLLTNGWLMLSDFAQREYPDIVTNEEGDEHTSWLPTREKDQQQKKPDFTEKVRHFEPGLSHLEPEDIEKMISMKDSDQRQAFTVVVPQARGDKGSKQVYSGPQVKLEIPDRLFNNVLVGKDIIPGLASRAGLEVARIGHVNPALGQKLSKLRGDALMLFILKDSFRPQAMIPNGLSVKEEHVQPNPKLANQQLMEMTDKIIRLGHRLKESESDIMQVIDKEMTDIMYLGPKKLDEQVDRMKKFLQELEQRAPTSIKHSSLFEECDALL